jgi:hypothetical protein
VCKSNSWLLYTMLNIQISINKGLWLYFNTKFFSKFNDLNDNAIIIVRFQMSKFIRNAVTLSTQWSLNFQMSKLISLQKSLGMHLTTLQKYITPLKWCWGEGVYVTHRTQNLSVIIIKLSLIFVYRHLYLSLLLLPQQSW